MNRKSVFMKIILPVIVIFLIINVVAFMHAYRFTHVANEGVRTKRPEVLSVWGKIQTLFTGVRVIKRPNETTPEDHGYSYRSRIIRDENFETPVWEIDADTTVRTVLLFHGYNGNKSSLLHEATWFLNNQSNVVLVDFPGCGDSPYNWTTIGYREADVVKLVYDYYRDQIKQPVILYGISLGASSITAAFHKHKINPDAIILEMPFGSLHQTVQQRFKLMGFPFTFPFSQLLVFWGSVQMGYNGFSFNPAEYANEITSPALLLGGENDFRAPHEMLERMYANLNGYKEIYIFKNAGHYSLYSERPDEYDCVAGGFLESEGL